MRPDQGVMAEMFWRPDADLDRRTGFLVYSRDSGDVAEKETVEVGGTTFYPQRHLRDLLAKAVVRFPSGIEDYGTTVDLFTSVKAFIDRYVAVGDDTLLDVCAAYPFLTWVYDKFNALPYLRVLGDFSTGKTRLIETVGAVCFRPTKIGGATTASPIFRVIDDVRGTLVVDEADFKGKTEAEDTITKILTSGYKRGFPLLRSERADDGTFEVRAFDTFGPKLIATRRPFADPALESRCFTHTMLATTDMGRRPIDFPPAFFDEALRLRNQLVLWRFRTWPTLTYDAWARQTGVDGQGVPWQLEARIDEMGMPLLTCAPTPTIRASIITALRGYNADFTDARATSWEGALLAVLVDEYHRATKRVRPGAEPPNIPVKTLADRLRVEAVPTATPKLVARILRRTLRFELGETHGARTVKVNERRLSRLAQQYGVTVRGPRPPAMITLPTDGPTSPVDYSRGPVVAPVILDMTLLEPPVTTNGTSSPSRRRVAMGARR